MRWLDRSAPARRDARRARQRAAARRTAVMDARAHDAFPRSVPRRHGVLLVLAGAAAALGACAVLVAAGAVSAAPLLPYVPLPLGAEPAAAAAAPLKVLTVNVSYRQFSARRLLEIVREADPDVVVVQELTPHAERVLAELDTAFPHYRKFPADGAVRHRALVALRRSSRARRSRSAACRRSKRACAGRRARSRSSACT